VKASWWRDLRQRRLVGEDLKMKINSSIKSVQKRKRRCQIENIIEI